jgi:hypothetical protein
MSKGSPFFAEGLEMMHGSPARTSDGQSIAASRRTDFALNMVAVSSHEQP